MAIRKIIFLVFLGVGALSCGADEGGGPMAGPTLDAEMQSPEDMLDAEVSPDVNLQARECGDGIDNDGDGLVDLDDPGCENALDTTERESQCNDGIDNDEDGFIDYPVDPGCASFLDDSEENPPQRPECADGEDNDRNGYVDEADPGCSSVADTTERPTDEMAQCSDRVDNDGDGVIDFPLELGCTAAGDDDEADPRVAPSCANDVDDDQDGLTDYPDDPGCFGYGDRDEEDKPITTACSDGIDNDRDGQVDYPEDPECVSAADGNEKGTCLDEYDPPRIADGQVLVVDSSRGDFSSAGSCGGQGSPETVVLFELSEVAEAIYISSDNEGTEKPSTLYVRYAECLRDDAELVCQSEVPGTPSPGQRVRIDNPKLGQYFIFVDGVAGEGGAVALSVEIVPPAQCKNQIDDDEDGAIDYPVDPGCELPSDTSEDDPAQSPICKNGLDDDEDGQVDHPADVGCIAASFGSEDDLCGAGVKVNEYLFGAEMVMGDTDAPSATNALDPNFVGCGRTGKPEQIFFYRNPYRSRLTISTDHPETVANTAVYLRSECTRGRSEIACSDGDGTNRGHVVASGVEPGDYFIVVDTAVGLGGQFKLTVVSEYDEPQCSDHVDNDGDGTVDDEDAGCSGQSDRSERQSSGTPECNNGLDDDEDGRTDWPFDPGCEARGDDSEADPEVLPACFNNRDDDGDGLVDLPNDPGCTSRGDNDETDLRIPAQCSNERDDDGDGLTDYGEDPDCAFAGDRTE